MADLAPLVAVRAAGRACVLRAPTVQRSERECTIAIAIAIASLQNRKTEGGVGHVFQCGDRGLGGGGGVEGRTRFVGESSWRT